MVNFQEVDNAFKEKGCKLLINEEEFNKCTAIIMNKNSLQFGKSCNNNGIFKNVQGECVCGYHKSYSERSGEFCGLPHSACPSPFSPAAG